MVYVPAKLNLTDIPSQAGADPGFCFGGQVERRRRANCGTTGAECGWDMERGCPPPIVAGVWGAGSAPSPFFYFWGLESRILVHSLALLSADFIAAFAQ